jgi:hypothetical protein
MSSSRAASAQNAGRYLRELLRTEPRYRHRWMRYHRDRERDVHQVSVAKVLAAELNRNPRRRCDPDVTADQLVHVVSRALKPIGTVLARETLRLFIGAFDMDEEHARLLWRQWRGDDPARIVTGQLPPLSGRRRPVRSAYETISLREYHYVGEGGRPVRHRTARDIRALADGLSRCRYSFDTGEVRVARISGGQPGPLYQRRDSVWAVDISLPRTLNAGDEHSLEFETSFRYSKPAESCVRQVAHGRLENLVMRVEFHPGRLPGKIFWTEWLDYREPKTQIVHEDLVDLDAEYAAERRLDVLDRAVVGFRWEF